LIDTFTALQIRKNEKAACEVFFHPPRPRVNSVFIGVLT
jgi:hypothetical protein